MVNEIKMNTQTDKHYPKVLLLCNFNQRTANGITIKNLFKNWPKDKIAVADYSSSIEEAYVDHIDSYYIIGGKEFDYIFPFNKIISKNKSISYNFIEKDFLPDKTKSEGIKRGFSFRIKSLITSLYMFALHATGLSLVLKKYKVSNTFKQWLFDFNPDIIYSSTSNIGNINFLIEIRSTFNKKLVFHVFDDFVDSGNSRIIPLLKKYWNNKLRNAYVKLIKFTDLDLAISEKMALEYNQRYGKKYVHFHNPIDESIWLKSERNESVTTDLNSKLSESSFTFIYTGKINNDTAPVLKDFLKSIKGLTINSRKVLLEIYTQSSYDEAFSQIGSILEGSFKGYLPNNQLPVVLSSGDALLLPLSFKKSSIKYTKLSIATKATEYMISGTPIFCYAPADIALTEYLSRYDAAFIADQSNKLSEYIYKFITNEQLRKEISSNALTVATQKHLSKTVTEDFRKRLIEIVQ